MPEKADSHTADEVSTAGTAKAPAVVIYALVGSAAFLLALAVTHLVTHWNFITTLFYETNLAKYEVMAGERGPTTYLIFHKNFDDLKAFADASDDILGVEQSDFSSVAKMAFRSAKSPLIEEIRNHPSVTNMVNRNVPMICH